MYIRKEGVCLQLIAVAVSVLVIATNAFAQRTGSPANTRVGHGSIATYSKEFAKRFMLPDPEPGMDLAYPLLALELQISPAPHMPEANQCLLSVYIDSRLPLHFPTDGPIGTAEVGYAFRHFFIHPDKGREHWLTLSVEDRRYFGRITSQFNNNAALATVDFSWSPPKGSFASFAYRAFHRELFPSVSYLQLDVGCPFPRWLSVPRSIHLWLKRHGGKDFSQTIQVDPKDFEKLEIPAGYVQRMGALERTLRR